MIKNFTFTEFIHSDTAEENNIYNVPEQCYIIENLLYTINQMQIVRDLLCQPIFITSGYRCFVLNKLVNGSKYSQHPEGKADDFISPKFGNPKEICEKIRNSGLEYDQLILEPSWVHISFDKNGNRRMFIDMSEVV